MSAKHCLENAQKAVQQGWKGKPNCLKYMKTLKFNSPHFYFDRDSIHSKYIFSYKS